MDSRFGSIDGVLRVTAGYAGGTTPSPTYRSIGDHSEAVRVVYDPTKVSYRDLLAVFWDAHDPRSRPWSRQYRNALFYHTPEQERAARESLREVEGRLGGPVRTALEPAGPFYRAEAYHQKYVLRSRGRLWRALVEHFGGEDAAADSTAAARLNGWLGGYGTPTAEAVEALDLPQDLRALVLAELGLAEN
ncbi:peptide-methionine (S)-S-oxide reductase MsrA [Deferrisoma palaeochoriense]